MKISILLLSRDKYSMKLDFISKRDNSGISEGFNGSV